MPIFKKAKWIWCDAEAHSDEYADFRITITAKANKKYTLKLAADSNYALYINGCLAQFGQYADYPSYKIADVIDITHQLKDGINILALTVWYYGADGTMTYKKGDAGVIFEIDEDDSPAVWSDKSTPSRLSRGYVSHEARLISSQLGYTYHFDATAYDGFYEGIADGFSQSREIDTISREILPRPTKKLILSDRLDTEVCASGAFKYEDPTDRPEINMQNATFSDANIFSSSGKPTENEGVFFIVDLGRESAGFLDFDLEVDDGCRIDIGWGEHLTDGRCRTAVRNFSAVYDAKPGRNVFLNQFRRFGCRYIQFFVHASSVKINYAGLRPTVYPLNIKKFASGNALRDKIYAVCENTLIQSMHEHYEDCPWREQALYCMDSRNQMLCGYYAFGEYEFPRANLELMTHGLTDSGLLSICFPCGSPLVIPSFNAVFFIQMDEYIRYSGDTTLASEHYRLLKDLMNTFLKRKNELGLIRSFEEKQFWNFYEWSDDLQGHIWGEDRNLCESSLNAFVSLALSSLSNISRALERYDDAEMYQNEAINLNLAIKNNFFDLESGLFINRLNQRKYSVLANSLCLLCGAAGGLDISDILSALSTNGNECVTPNTLSMNSFRFDALLSADRAKYKDVILCELDRDYKHMLDRGATSFWETIKGEADFLNAGSLCHGWSALPIYYYEILSE